MSITTMKLQKQEVDTGLKRYNLVVPSSLFNEVQSMANSQHTTVLDLLRRLISIGLTVARIAQNPSTSFIIREDSGREREILFA